MSCWNWMNCNEMQMTQYSAVIYDAVVHAPQQLQGWNFGHICTHSRHPIPRPYRRAMGCLSWDTKRKITAIYRERTVYTYWISRKCVLYFFQVSLVSYLCHGYHICASLRVNSWNDLFPHKGSEKQIALKFSLLLAWRSCWTNNRSANSFRCHDAHVATL